MTDATRERAAPAIPSLLSIRPGGPIRTTRTGRLWSMPAIFAAISLMLFFAVFLADQVLRPGYSQSRVFVLKEVSTVWIHE